MTRVYLDHNATSPLRPEAKAALVAALEVTGNTSSVHAEGRKARSLIEEARDRIAALVGGRSANVIFTSGGTEGVNLLLNPAFRRSGDARTSAKLLVSAGEHACVLSGHRFPARDVVCVPLTTQGAIDLKVLAQALSSLAPDVRPVLALQAANNETGVIQPVGEASRIVHEAGGLVICDAVQAAGKVPLHMADLGVDALIVSAHKFGGPQSVGAVVLASSVLEIGHKLIGGGGQEQGRRAGTQNAALIQAMGVAAQVAGRTLASDMKRLCGLRDQVETGLKSIAPDLLVMGEAVSRLPNTSCFVVPDLAAETLLMAFDLQGCAVSSGAACSSGKVKPSHVLQAMGHDEAMASCAIRVSLGWSTTENDVIRFLVTCENVIGALYKKRDAA